MKRWANWVCHRNKIPIDPKTGGNAKSNDSTTWGTYEQAKSYMEHDKSISGLGFMFANSPYVGIDIDHCITDGKLSTFAKEIITKVQSYTEVSPSGTGIHIICKGKLAGAGKKNSELGLEMYDTGRYFTVTEKNLKHYSKIGERQQEIDSIYQTYFKQEKTKQAPKQQVFSNLDDEKLIEIAKKSKNGWKFADLLAGNWQTYYKSQSEADIAFCNMLAFWTGGDLDQMDRIFRISGLMRDKWDKKHGVHTYGDMTLTKAVDMCDEVFEPSMTRDFNTINKVSTDTKIGRNVSEKEENVSKIAENDIKTIETDTKVAENENESTENEEKTTENENETPSLDRFHRFNGKGQIMGVFDVEIVDYIIKHENIVKIGDVLYLYHDGVYKEDRKGETLKYKIQNLIYREFQTSRTINRVYDLILIQPSLKKQYWQLNQFPEHWVNFKNGMLNVETMELLPHSPEYYSMNQIPHEYKALTKADLVKFPNSKQFLMTSFHKEDIDTIFEYMGTCLTHSTLYQIFLLLKGEGANGKSITIDLFNAVIGEENTTNLPMDRLTQRFYPAQLLFKLINTCADISKISIEDDAELKKIIGGDVLQGEFKGKDSFSFRPYAKMLFSANRFPHVDDKSDGFKRRLRVIAMDKKPEKKDVHLKEKLLKEIDFWVYVAVQGLRKVLERHDVYESENSKNEKKNIHKDSDSVYAFVQDCIRVQEGESVLRSDMFKEYEKYCDYYERIRVKKRTFFEELKAKGFVTKKDRKGYMIYENIYITIWEDDTDINFTENNSKKES